MFVFLCHNQVNISADIVKCKFQLGFYWMAAWKVRAWAIGISGIKCHCMFFFFGWLVDTTVSDTYTSLCAATQSLFLRKNRTRALEISHQTTVHTSLPRLVENIQTQHSLIFTGSRLVSSLFSLNVQEFRLLNSQGAGCLAKGYLIPSPLLLHL